MANSVAEDLAENLFLQNSFRVFNSLIHRVDKWISGVLETLMPVDRSSIYYLLNKGFNK